ncbi:hypothetical protein GCM10009616_15090 [Microlunatus lacustris]
MLLTLQQLHHPAAVVDQQARDLQQVVLPAALDQEIQQVRPGHPPHHRAEADKGEDHLRTLGSGPLPDNG